MRRCTKCGVERPLSEFHSNSRGGRRAQCRTCESRRNQDRAARVRKGATYVAQAEAAAKLVVTTDDPELLQVDAEALMRNEHDVRYWGLRQVDGQPGQWRHPESGSSGPLSEVLRSIADCYLHRPEWEIRQEREAKTVPDPTRHAHSLCDDTCQAKALQEALDVAQDVPDTEGDEP